MTQRLYFSSRFVIGYNIERKTFKTTQSNSETFSLESPWRVSFWTFLLVNLIFAIYLSKSYANEKVLKIYLELFGENDVHKFVILELTFSFQEEERSQAVPSI